MVTLVVTIVIMIILIGITVNLTIGNNGIVTRTKQAKKDIEQTALNEQYQMNVLYDEMMATSGSSGGDISTEGIPDSIIEYIEAKLEANAKDNMLKIYPVGSIYISTEATDPSELFGGTWESYGEGRTLVGVENGQESEQTGGSKTATLAIENLPSHTHSIDHTHTTPQTKLTDGITNKAGSHFHTFYFDWPINDFGLINTASIAKMSQEKYMATNSTSAAGEHTHTVTGTIPSMTTNSISTTNSGTTGSGTSFSVENPYITTYMWKRTQ